MFVTRVEDRDRRERTDCCGAGGVASCDIPDPLFPELAPEQNRSGSRAEMGSLHLTLSHRRSGLCWNLRMITKNLILRYHPLIFRIPNQKFE